MKLALKRLELSLIYIRDMIVPIAPLPHNFQPEIRGYRERCKYLTWVLKHRGFTISQDLPGVDRPDAVSQAMQEHSEWMLSWLMLFVRETLLGALILSL